ncbi:LicD family protein [Loigolactobacillus zhaoyuanensis]|uniref:LicD family protein n=1 Tax=Loigolactobacillus zhaoyuanensis TaxID=2486017 RepID=UPI0013DDCF75|nr:LicD family protein [Loigolactobacillus zhaoyuanensis]
MGSQLEQLHQVEINILRVVVKICDQEQIPYFLIGGSLLGAVRHQGFIPWDDDIDIGFLRVDYERFLAVAPSYLADKSLALITEFNTADYGMAFAKIIATNTEITEEQNLPNRSVSGLYIDLFPLDRIPKSTFQRRRQYVEFKMLTKTILERLNYGQVDGRLKRILVTLINLIFGLFSTKTLKNWRLKVATRYQEQTELDVINISSQYPYGREIILRSEQQHLQKHNFEQLKVSIPQAYDTILTRMYHDYMQLPPKSAQKEKHLTTLMIDGEKIE